jgi:hypothetical protein
VIALREAGPPAAEQAIHALELRYGVQIPPSYLSFLLINDGAIPEENMLSGTAWEHDMVSVDQFLGLSDAVAESISDVWDAYGDRLPRGWFPFATAAGGNTMLLAIEGPGYGQVAFWDHELEGTQEALTVVARTFDDFFARLTPPTD